jgi:predicted thioesterase
MPVQPLRPGLHAVSAYAVAAADTAAAVGSGDLDVLATPRLLAWMEGVTCAAVADHLSGDETTVGSRVSLEHLAASPVGVDVVVQASLVHVDGRLLRFEAVAHQGDTLVGRADITRVRVDRRRFLARAAGEPPS